MSEAPAEAHTPGSRLRFERERLGISLQEAADDMKLDPWALEALEGDDFARLGPAVYAKGHLKKYASLLGVPGSEIIGAYEALKNRPSVPAANARQGRLARALLAPLPWPKIAGGVAFAFVAALVWWKPWQRTPSKPATTASLVPSAPHAGSVPTSLVPSAPQAGSVPTSLVPSAPQAGSVPASLVPSAPQAGSAPAGAAAHMTAPVADALSAGTPGAPTADALGFGPGAGALPLPPTGSAAAGTFAQAFPGGAGAGSSAAGSFNGDFAAAGQAGAKPAGPMRAAPATPAAYAPTAAYGRARLRMAFSADSWVDVRDAAGRRLYTGRGRANTVRSLGGSAPLRVYIGFASGVQLQVNDHAVAIGPQFLNGDIARFQAGADGVLRRDPASGNLPGPPPAGTTPGVATPGRYSRNDSPRG